MKAQRIVELLHEAMQIGMNNPILPQGEIRLARIQVELADAAFQDYELEEIGDAAKAILTKLFVSTVEHRPERLLELYPVFDMLCGDRSKDSWLSDIGWDVADLARALTKRQGREDPTRRTVCASITAVDSSRLDSLRKPLTTADAPSPYNHGDMVRSSLQKLKEMSCPDHHAFVLLPSGVRACPRPGCNWTDNLGSEATNWMPPPK